MAKNQPDCRGLSRAEARRVREKYWRRLVAEQRSSGLKHSEFCRQQDISYHAYIWWKRKIAEQKGGNRSAKYTRPAGAALYFVFDLTIHP